MQDITPRQPENDGDAHVARKEIEAVYRQLYMLRYARSLRQRRG